jgi:hypothetical protein
MDSQWVLPLSRRISGMYCHSYLNSPAKAQQPQPHLSALVFRLDNESGLQGKPHDSKCLKYPENSEGGQKDENVINKALRSAIYAFSMRWLRGSGASFKPTADQQAQTRRSKSVWHQARRDIESAMSMPSYRSILALHIFGLTPVPPDHHHDDEQIRDLCIEIALNHHNRLRSEDNGVLVSSLPAVSTPLFDIEEPQTQLTAQETSGLQSMLYWFSVLEDTSRSVRRSCCPVMSGYIEAWALVELNENNFEETLGFHRYFDEPMPDETAYTILKHASASNKMFWAAIGRVQGAAKLHQPFLLECAISDAFTRLSRFDEVFKLLLDRCNRDILLLNEENQLAYCELLAFFEIF